MKHSFHNFEGSWFRENHQFYICCESYLFFP